MKKSIPQMIPGKGKELPPTKGRPIGPRSPVPTKKAPPRKNTKKNY